MKRSIRVFAWICGAMLVGALSVWVAFQLSPWPGVLVIRALFDGDSQRVLTAQQKHVPAGIETRMNENYDSNNPTALLDIYYPPEAKRVRNSATVVWVHGGGWVSGGKWQLANYARILAGCGFTVVCVDYTIAPDAKYPTPLRQLNSALGWLVTHADQLGVVPRFVLAGDSAGANISAQLANIVVVPAYADAVGIAPLVGRSQLAGLLLYCGPYDAEAVNYEGAMGGFLRTVLWSYFGRKDFREDPRLKYFSVVNHVTAAFPPTFISVGNGDPLRLQSQALATKLAGHGVKVETLFFPADRQPALPHEYQFNLDNEAGRLALERSTEFLLRLR
jgi:acetyl esterase/lipase